LIAPLYYAHFECGYVYVRKPHMLVLPISNVARNSIELSYVTDVICCITGCVSRAVTKWYPSEQFC